MTTHPGFEPALKLLDGESLNATAAAMQCTGSKQERLLALEDAQAMARAVSSLKRKLCGYREIALEPTKQPEQGNPYFPEGVN